MMGLILKLMNIWSKYKIICITSTYHVELVFMILRSAEGVKINLMIVAGYCVLFYRIVGEKHKSNRTTQELYNQLHIVSQ